MPAETASRGKVQNSPFGPPSACRRNKITVFMVENLGVVFVGNVTPPSVARADTRNESVLSFRVGIAQLRAILYYVVRA